MAENGNGKGGVEPGEGRQQAGQELHWAPRYGGEGMRGFTHGTGGMWKSVPQERERGWR